MSSDMAICLPADETALLGKLRRRAGIEVCVDKAYVWLRATQASEESAAELRVLPGVHFTILPDGQLVEFGKRVPNGHLPDKPWISLSQWIHVEVESPIFSGLVVNQVPFGLVRSTLVAEPNVLLTSFVEWQSYAINAPQFRLERLSFAVGEENRVVVRGTPLPPCAGVRFVEEANVAVQAGWYWTPAVSAEIVRAALGLEEFALALFHADHTWDLIPAEAFVRATRSAVRLSMAELNHG